MKLECVREKLRNAVVAVERMTGKNLSLPVLGLVLLEAREGELVIKATNLDVGAEIAVPAKVEKAGTAAVSGSVLGGFLGMIGGAHAIKLETVNENLYLSSDHHSTLLKSQSSADFPTIPRIDDGVSFEIPAERLVSGIRAVVYSAALSDMKPEISSVYVYGAEQSLLFVATDSFRLAEKKLDLGPSADGVPPLLIPLRNAADIARVFEGVEGDVVVTCNKNQIAFSVPGIYLTSRLVSGVFPNYRQIVPTAKKTSVSVSKQELSSALKLSQIFSDKFNQVSFKIMPGERMFEVGSRSSETGENTTKLDAALEGEDVEIHFNVKYILDCFQSIPEDTVTLDFNGAGKPVVLRGAGNNSFTYLVMPMNK